MSDAKTGNSVVKESREVNTVKIVAELELVPTSDGGRSSSILAGVYRTLFEMGGVNVTCTVTGLKINPLKPGQKTEATLEVLSVHLFGDQTFEGRAFRLKEGPKTVANGVVLATIQ